MNYIRSIKYSPFTMMNLRERMRDSGKLAVAGMALVLGVLVALTSVTVSADVVEFPDPELEAAIREAVGRSVGNIHDTYLIGLTTLNLEGYSIANLEGLQYCTNLTELWLWTNSGVDISPLEELANLTRFFLNGNQVDIRTSKVIAALEARINALERTVESITALEARINALEQTVASLTSEVATLKAAGPTTVYQVPSSSGSSSQSIDNVVDWVGNIQDWIEDEINRIYGYVNDFDNRIYELERAHW